MNANGKRTTAVLLGTDWAATASDPSEPTACRKACCQYRKPMTESAKKEWCATGKGVYLCKRCGGSRVAGDGNFTVCAKRGKVTLCQGCFKIIEP